MNRLRNYFRLGVIVTPVPQTLVNDSVNDANQVMANFNHIVAQVNANAVDGATLSSTVSAAVTAALAVALGSFTTYTPDVRFGGASTGITYASRGGAYINLNGLVFFVAYAQLTNKGSSTGPADITTPSSNGANWPPGGSGFPIATMLTSNVTLPGAPAQGVIGSGAVSVAYPQSGSNWVSLTEAQFSNTSLVMTMGFYRP